MERTIIALLGDEDSAVLGATSQGRSRQSLTWKRQEMVASEVRHERWSWRLHYTGPTLCGRDFLRCRSRKARSIAERKACVPHCCSLDIFMWLKPPPIVSNRGPTPEGSLSWIKPYLRCLAIFSGNGVGIGSIDAGIVSIHTHSYGCLSLT